MMNLFKRLFSGAPTCEEVNGFIADYLDDELDPLTKQKFVKHVSDCSCCHEFLEQYRTTIALIREAEDIEPPKELVEKTLIFLESQRPQ